MRTLFGAVLLAVFIPLLALPFASASREGDEAESAAQRERGAAVYALRCAVCHGKTGQGLNEARLAFPEDHRRCTRCHKQGNAARMATPFVDNNMFDTGDAPALVGEEKLVAFPNAAVLHSYIRAAMPRHAPGSLAEAEYWDVTAHLLELNHALPQGAILTEQNAATFSLP